MIDIHCHILPAVDDGPATLKEALAMAKIAFADGTRRIVATPHVKDDPLTPQEIQEQVASFNQALREAKIALEVVAGADASASLSPRVLRGYTINGTDYVLCEFPHTHLPATAGEIVFRAVVEGLRPIVTHPERNPSIIQNPALLFDLINAGALVQVTADSLVGEFGSEVRACAIFLLQKGAVHFLATDGHSPHWRQPLLRRGCQAAAAIIGAEGAENLVLHNPARVLSGERLDA
jgi:protein-tyrosine phosphatase